MPNTTHIVVALLCLPAVGCATIWPRGPVEQNVVSSREFARRGIDAMQREDWGAAETLFGRAVASCPTDEEARCNYARSLAERGALDVALQQMREAVRLSGNDPRRMVQLGELYLAEGNAAMALAQAEAALAADRSLAAAWALRGDALGAQDRLPEALASYHAALGRQPRYPCVQLAVAEVYRRQNRPDRALAALQSLAGDYPPGHEPQQVLYLSGLAFKALGRHREAVDQLQTAAVRGEPTAELLYHLAEAQYLAGHPADALLATNEALAMSPDHAPTIALRERIRGGQPSMAATRPR
jgi:tetratricopeptide (TPR) repeat protein